MMVKHGADLQFDDGTAVQMKFKFYKIVEYRIYYKFAL